MNIKDVIIYFFLIPKVKLETSGDKFAAAFSVLLLSATLSFPLVIWLVMHFNFDKLKEKKAVDTYGSLY